MAGRLIFLLVFSAAVASAHAQMADPTRPPSAILQPSLAAESAEGPVLQSVLLPKKGRPVAMIGGQQVRLGETYGDSRLVHLSEREAVLLGPSGRERLLLTPGVEKTVLTPRDAGKLKTNTKKTSVAEQVPLRSRQP